MNKRRNFGNYRIALSEHCERFRHPWFPDRRLSMAIIAERLNVTHTSVGYWNTGRSMPRVDDLIRLAELFNTTIDKLIVGQYDKASYEPLEPFVPFVSEGA